MQFDEFVARGLAAEDLHLAARAIKSFRQETDQGFIRGGIHRWRGDFYSQFWAQGFADFITRRAGCDFDG